MSNTAVYWVVDHETATATWLVMVRDDGHWRKANTDEHRAAVEEAMREHKVTQ